VSKLPIFDQIAVRLCSSCYERDWFHKLGGSQGISILTSKLDLGIAWLRRNEIKVPKKKFFFFKSKN